MFQISGVKLQLIDIVPMFILWSILIGISFVLIYKKKKMKWTYSIILYITSLIIGGIILGGIPSAVMPFQQILMTITMGNPILTILPMIIMLIVLLGTTIIIGRQFCGYACPLGAAQELVSKLQFKVRAKEKEKGKYVLNIPKKIQLGIRGVIFIVFFLVAFLWMINLLQIVNPFLGFSIFMNPLGFVFWIPLISLGITIAASIFLYRPFCRFVCPFGALANLTSRISRYKIRRTEDCTECGLCEQVCPTNEAGRFDSKGECYMCNRCIDICPQNALELSN